jgi:hypothetical protein
MGVNVEVCYESHGSQYNTIGTVFQFKNSSIAQAELLLEDSDKNGKLKLKFDSMGTALMEERSSTKECSREILQPVQEFPVPV